MFSPMTSILKSFLCLDQKFLIWNMVTRTLKLRYRRSFLGFLWTLLVPLSTAGIYYFLFKVIFRVEVEDFAAFITVGILVWTFYSGTISESMESLLGNLSLLLQVNVPLNVFPLTTAISSLITLFFALPVIFGVCLISGISIGWSSIMILPYIALLFIQAYCFGYVLSVAVIYLRDLKQAVGLFMQLWMYGTPILYKIDLVPKNYTWVLYANPIGKIFPGIHNALLRNLWPTSAEILVPVAWTIGILLGTLFIHTKVSRLAIERI